MSSIRFQVIYDFGPDRSIAYSTNADRLLEEAVGSECSDSGSGFGKRDMGWYLDDEDTEAIKEKIMKLQLPGCEVSCYDEEDMEDETNG